MKAATTVEVHRPIEDVFADISTIEAMGEWVGGVGETHCISGDDTTVGARYESTDTYSGRTQPMVVELTAIDAPYRLELTAVEGLSPFDARLKFAETPSGTFVTNPATTNPTGVSQRSSLPFSGHSDDG